MDRPEQLLAQTEPLTSEERDQKLNQLQVQVTQSIDALVTNCYVLSRLSAADFHLFRKHTALLKATVELRGEIADALIPKPETADTTEEGWENEDWYLNYRIL